MNDKQKTGNDPSDTKSGGTKTDDTKPGEYTGPDQRRTTRRESTDRREDIRFDIKNDDRRDKRGRRKEDNLFWD
ncbi:MAG: hypothetical protein KBT63_01855 [Porticoccaceae bacterium]|nr:hypothetical protein [Porticoccaceae bacterium]